MAYAGEHVDGGVTDRRLALLPELYDDMLGRKLPLEPEERESLRRCRHVRARLRVAARVRHDPRREAAGRVLPVVPEDPPPGRR